MPRDIPIRYSDISSQKIRFPQANKLFSKLTKVPIVFDKDVTLKNLNLSGINKKD